MRFVDKTLAGLILVKSLYCIFALLIFGSFTTLGDSESYIAGSYLTENRTFTSSAFIMSLIGSSIGKPLSYCLACIASCYGIIYPLTKYNFKRKEKLLIFFIALLPSTGIWTSIYGKEAFIVLFLGGVIGFFIDICSNKKIRPTFFQLCCFLLLCIFKIQYAVVVLLIFTYLLFVIHIRGASSKILFNLALSLLGLGFIYFLFSVANFFDYFVSIIPSHFSDESNSTRINDFWLTGGDFFKYLPEGIFVSFVGPTLFESIQKPLFFPFFFEGILILFLVSLVSYKSIIYRSSKFNLFYGSIAIITIILFLLAHYPFGIFNPGSAVRYRSGFIIGLTTFLVFLSSILRRKGK